MMIGDRVTHIDDDVEGTIVRVRILADGSTMIQVRWDDALGCLGHRAADLRPVVPFDAWAVAA